MGRGAGLAILAAIACVLAWRIVVAPMVLGEFDPAVMPHAQRAFLSVGNVLCSSLFCAAIWLVSRTLPGDVLATWAFRFGAAAVVVALASTVGLIWSDAPGSLLFAYIVATSAAWVLIGVALFRRVGGIVGAAGLVTAALYGLATAAVFTGAMIIFLMTLGAAPLALALLIRGDQR